MAGKKAPGNSLNIEISNIPAMQGNDEMIRIQGEMKSAFVGHKPKNDPSMIDMKGENILNTNN
jgi:acyl-CoA-binding protein